MTINGDHSVQFDRGPGGVELKRRFSSGTVFEQQYDAAGRLSIQLVASGNGSGSSTIRREFTYDNSESVIQIRDGHRGDTRYRYDASDRVTEVDSRHGKTYYTYDLCGNITRIQDHEGNVTHFDYNKGNRVAKRANATYVYDGNGRLSRRLEEKTGESQKEWTFSWNARDELRSITTPDGRVWTYGYDALGRRVIKDCDTNKTRFVWDQHVVAQRIASNERTSNWVFEPGTFTPMCKIDGAECYSIVSDHLGTPLELLRTDVAEAIDKSPQPSNQTIEKRSSDADGQINVTIHAPGSELRVVWLRDGQQAVFGRSQEADVWVETDPQLSSRHFEIISEGGACAIRDLESQNGTLVNDAVVTFEVLCNGDVIRAGETRFVVATNTSPESSTRSSPASWQRTDCPSGICAFAGTLGPVQTLLSRFRGAWCVVNVPELNEHPLPQPRWLYSWLPSNVAGDLSPAILAGDEAENHQTLLDEAAQHQAVFGVVSDCEASDLRLHLIAVARGQKRLTGVPQAELMFANHPFAALEQLFRTCDPEYADFVFSRVQALVFPIDDGNQSVVLAPPAFEQQLETAAPRTDR